MAALTRSAPSEQERMSHEMGMHTEKLGGRSRQAFFDIDLNEAANGFVLPNAYDVDFNKRSEIDASNMPSKNVNLRNLIIDGSLGYFGLGLIDGPNVRISGRVGWSCAENMMSGTILIEKNAGSQFGAAIRGGDLVCRGDVGSRTGIDMKGGTIIVGGNTGAFTGFMMQRGRMVICGNAGKNLGDSMYDGTIYIGGEPASLGVDAVWAEITDLERNWLERKLRQYDLLPKSGIGHFRKIFAGKQLWNYDDLEPTEKKLVL